ncbi:trehalose-phosphatase [Microbacterium terricola]|uniref:Trehalose 6-phosphate phosphatase n=1 Tax=Microbacterium terricola TaxID=344163 RepID=A0ABM8DZ10_9MICO|nr:trehalose-phosphatase [Microbacterium terricola]UYK41300.1 trehalose-phosphatase [Microbacterium terricola]BDV30918.1 trehalose 6-phosphate phosphatase [Microbacterium terricola]
MTIDAAQQPDEAEAELRRIAAAERLLVALDFDGTLSPLVDDPMQARMAPEARAALDALIAAPATTVALVSGRSLHDLREIAEHADDSPLLLAGSHGAEYWTPGAGAIEPDDDADERELRDTLRAHAEQTAAAFDGVWIEPKTFGFGVHTRLSSPEDAAAAREAIDGLVAAEAAGWRRRTGHNIVEYAFRQEGKDTAVAALRERTEATAVLFAGDDVTDEDAIAGLDADDLGVRVGAGDTSAAIRVTDISAFAALLERLAELRGAARE